MKKTTIWAITALVGGYVFCQLLADIAATKLVMLGTVVIPAGTFIFTVTFTLRDMLHKRLGKEWAKAAIWLAAAFNLLMAAYLQGMARLPAPVYYPYSKEWSAIFAFVPAITVASILAELVSELLDTEVYHWWGTRFTKAPQWTRVLISNAVSLPVDSLIFAGLGFLLLPPLFGGQALPVTAIPGVVGGQILWKAVVTLISLPAIYMVKENPLAAGLALGDHAGG